MMSNLPSRSYGRSLTRVNAQTDLELAAINASGELDSARIDNLQAIAGRAMHGVAMVAQLEGQLGSLVPLAVSRLQAIGDMHALASTDMVARAARRLA
jgi:hypothetical protein